MSGRRVRAVPAGVFILGDHFDDGNDFDGETPVRAVSLLEFDIDETPVTNAQFAEFVDASGHVTEAERFGTSAVFHSVVAAADRDVLGRSPSAPWWIEVRGADWRHPAGPGSDLEGLSDHPVVHVSWHDATAYSAWAGRTLPSEDQWEAAARGGLIGARYPWGDELLAGSMWPCNIWQGAFPDVNTAEDGWVATSPVRTYQPNGYGLYDMAGNVWEWTRDQYAPRLRRAPRALPLLDDRRATRGGSYLCHDSYCNRYRVSARTGNTPDSSAANCGFRTVSKAPDS